MNTYVLNVYYCGDINVSSFAWVRVVNNKLISSMSDVHCSKYLFSLANLLSHSLNANELTTSGTWSVLSDNIISESKTKDHLPCCYKPRSALKLLTKGHFGGGCKPKYCTLQTRHTLFYRTFCQTHSLILVIAYIYNSFFRQTIL